MKICNQVNEIEIYHAVTCLFECLLCHPKESMDLKNSLNFIDVCEKRNELIARKIS